MDFSSSSLLAAAIGHHRVGRKAAARMGYREALALDPSLADALHLQGVLELQDDRPADALRLFDRAIAVRSEPTFRISRADALRGLGRLGEAAAVYAEAIGAGGRDHPKARHALADTLRDLGRREEAAAVYREVVGRDPGNVEARFSLGAMAYALGQAVEAEQAFRVVLAAGADLPVVRNNLGAALQAQGRAGEAVESFRAALRLDPDNPEALSNLAGSLEDLGRLDEAETACRTALRLRADYAVVRVRLARLLRATKRTAEAEAECRAAADAAPQLADTHVTLGDILQDLERWEEAEAAYRVALRLAPDDPLALNNLGNALEKQGRSDEALETFDAVLVNRPDFAEAHNNRGISLQALRRLDEAEKAYRTALVHHPLDAPAHINLGLLFQIEQRYDTAAAAFRAVAALTPDHPETYCNLGNVLAESNGVEGAIAAYRRALAVRPAYPEALSQIVRQQQIACCWDGLAEREAELLGAVRAGRGGGSPFVLLGVPGATLADQLAGARTWSATKEPRRPIRYGLRPPPDRRIRVGYLSADLHEHATAFLMAEQFESHDRERFHTVAYSAGPDDGSAMRKRLEAAFDRFVDVRALTDDDAARRIHGDGIDLLIDLKGHTAYARAGILARRPAPVQAQHIGYPGTMGAGFIDYTIADAITVPPEDERFYTENVVRLPHCYQPNDTRRHIAETTPTRRDAGLPEQGFVFCCFNNPYKITPDVFAVWMRLLAARSGSALWLLAVNPLVAVNLRREAAARGVAPERLVFAERARLPDHLARHRLADLFLDTLPYNAHTTASDALWAGLPVVTRAGATYAGRVAASLLTACGLDDLITHSADSYESLALALSANPERLSVIKARLAENLPVCPLFDCRRFTRNLELAYETMWSLHRSGQPPQTFDVAERA